MIVRQQHSVSNKDSAISMSGLCRIIGLAACALLSSCNTTLYEEPMDESRHLNPPEETTGSGDIPAVVVPLPLLTEPQVQETPELYSVVAQDQSVRAILFAMARDAAINIDIHPGITGQVSINAIDQSLPQILERVSRQVDIRWSYDATGNLLVEPDAPFWHVYRVDYVNVEREATTSVNVSNTSTANGNDSSATITQTSSNTFWSTLTTNLSALLGEDESSAETTSVVANPESGLINIWADSKQHQEIESFLNFVHNRSLQEVMIEATIVEVSLNDSYQSGVDWTAVSGDVSFNQNLLGATLANPPTNTLTVNGSEMLSTVRLLSQFGDLKVLSSPKIMALNNQPAMLRVVDNTVYFSIEVQPEVRDANGVISSPTTFTSNVETVPVGFVMTITPQIGDDGQVTLNVRPTISRIVRFVNDPNPDLANAGVENPVPEIQVREIESILKVFSGQIAVLGGLMQDSLEESTAGLPFASRIPGIRNLFSRRDEAARKTELIIFIRPIIINQPSLNGDFDEYQQYLPANSSEFFNQNSFIQPLN